MLSLVPHKPSKEILHRTLICEADNFGKLPWPDAFEVEEMEEVVNAQCKGRAKGVEKEKPEEAREKFEYDVVEEAAEKELEGGNNIVEADPTQTHGRKESVM